MHVFKVLAHGSARMARALGNLIGPV